MNTMTIEAGDSVKHGPTGETWFVLGVDNKRGKACIAGWPPTICDLSDLTLVDKGNGIDERERKYRQSEFGDCWE